MHLSERYQWRRVTDRAAFAPRDGAGALTFDGQMWLLGGWNPDDKTHFPHICNSEVWRSGDGREWDLCCAAAPWEGRHTAGYAVHRGRMWVVGGDANQGHYQPDVWSSDDGQRWTCATQRAPWGPRVLHYTVAFADRLWVMGGQTLPPFAPAEERFYADVWCSADGAHWRQVADDAPWAPCGMIGGGAVWRDRIWLLGGGTYSTPGRPRRLIRNDVWSSGDGVRWERAAAPVPWAPRQYHEVAVFDDRLWVLEGCTPEGGNRNDVWCSPDGERWQELPDTPWAPRHAASVFVFDGSLWVVAGNNMQSDVWRLDVRGAAT